MSDAEKQQLREEIAQEKFDKSFEELDSDEVSWADSQSLFMAEPTARGQDQPQCCRTRYTITMTVQDATHHLNHVRGQKQNCQC
jgi:hypothetical protein